MTMTVPENGTTAERDQAFRGLADNARAMLAAGSTEAQAAQATGLSLATVRSLTVPGTAGPVEAAGRGDVPPPSLPDAPDPAGAPDAAGLLRRARSSGDRRVLTVAARIRHDLDLLAELLANSAEVRSARRRVEALERRRAALEEQIAQAQEQLDAARGAAPEAPSDGLVGGLAYSGIVRRWLRENGCPQVGARGRIKTEYLAVYLAAHPGAGGDA